MGCSVTGCLMMGCLVMGRLVMGRFVWSPKYLYLTQKMGTKAKFWAQTQKYDYKHKNDKYEVL